MPRQAIVIMTDTQRWDMVNCYRQTGLQTPHLDRLAADGIRFDRAYTCQPVCGPARAALFTGTFPHSNGSWGNLQALGLHFRTIGQRLTDAGIHCGYMGKWHLDGTDYFGNGKCPEGWDPKYWYDMRNYLEELPPEDRVRSRECRTNRDPNLKAEFTYGHRVSDRAIRFLEENKDRDFLLVVSYDEPHGPFLCPRPFSEMYRDYEFPISRNVTDSLSDKPAHHRVWADGRPKRDRSNLKIKSPDYFGCNSFVDHEIGRVLDAIDARAPESLVIYTSDHGDALESHQINNKGAAMYEEITRIPFIVRWPKNAPAGSACPHPVTHIDVVPSLIEYFGRPVVPFLEGKSMLATMRDPSYRTNDAVFVEFGRYEVDHDAFGGFQPIRCVVNERYKLVVNLLTSDEFYDLQADPGEMTNRIDSPAHAQIRDRMHDRLLQWMNETRDPFRGYYWACRPWRPGKKPDWENDYMTRQRADDGYEVTMLDYGNGLEIKETTRRK